MPAGEVENVVAAVVPLGAAVLGALAGTLVNRAAGRFPWPAGFPGGVVLGPGDVAVRPPVLEVLGAALFALLAARFGPSGDLPVWLWFGAVGLLLSVIDLRERLIPNRVLAPATAALLILLVVAAAAGGAWDALLRAVLAGAASFAVGLSMALLVPQGLGMGDVKLAGFLGIALGWLGWPFVLLGFFLGFLLQAALGLALLVARRVGRRGELPFGPALVGGALFAAVWAGEWAVVPGGI